MKALRLPFSEKNFEVCLLCSYVLVCDSWGGVGPVLNPGTSYEQTW